MLSLIRIPLEGSVAWGEYTLSIIPTSVFIMKRTHTQYSDMCTYSRDHTLSIPTCVDDVDREHTMSIPTEIKGDPRSETNNIYIYICGHVNGHSGHGNETVGGYGEGGSIIAVMIFLP